MQMKHFAGSLAGVCAVIAVCAGTAHAQTGDVGPTYVYRPLVLPEGVLRIDAGPRRPFGPGQVWSTGQLQFHINRDFQDFAFLVPGAAYGIMDRLEVGVVWPIEISPDVDLLDLNVYGKYELQLGKVDIAAFGEIRIPIQNDFELTAGVPIYIHLSDTLRLDTGGFMRLVFGDDVAVILTAPLALAVQATRDVFLGPELAIEVYDFDEVNVPLGIFGGYTIRDGGRTLGDLIGRFAIVDVENGFDAVRFDLGVELYFDP